MKKNLLIILFFLLFNLKGITGFATIHNIINSGFTFSPDSVSAHLGDTVAFTLSSFHSAIEVSQATWNINGNTSNGGFQTPNGGGMIILNQVKTYYYVCGIHFASGMKGRIFVTNPTGINDSSNNSLELDVFPNPCSDRIHIRSDFYPGKEKAIRLFSITGSCLIGEYRFPSDATIFLNEFPQGIYFIELTADDKRIVKTIIITR
ncbi:MAG: T9SS type A sorting domain-containing protein [Bacteroidetes bacterium]|nr:T9SS type A sorting domain-containing protein [Bacteroidota bacterium]